MDAGLFGEHLLMSLIHAVDTLLLPTLPAGSLQPPVSCISCRDYLGTGPKRNGIVVPFGATLWLAAIECKEIARKHRFSTEKDAVATSDLGEPYDTVDLKTVPGGFKLLCGPLQCFYIDFNDLKDMKNHFNGKHDDDVYKLTCICDGNIDAFVTWFDLHLDEDIKLSSTPFPTKGTENATCWDQAVFPTSEPVIVSPHKQLNVKVKTQKGKLHVELCETEIEVPSSKSKFPVSKEVTSFLNNTLLKQILLDTARLLPKDVENVLDMSPFPVLGLELLRINKDVKLCVFVANSTDDIEFVKAVASEHSINIEKLHCVMAKDFERDEYCCGKEFHLIIPNMINSTGELEEIYCLQKYLMLRDLPLLVPKVLNVWGQLIHSDWLLNASMVKNEGLIEKYKIANFINEFKSAEHLDLCIHSLEHTALSQPIKLLELETALILKGETIANDVELKVEVEGEATALLYWFEYKTSDKGNEFSSRHSLSHVNQTAVLVQPTKYVSLDELLKINARFDYRNLVFKFL